MKRNELEERLIDFSVLIIKLSNDMNKTKAGQHLSGQIIRSGTSVALNYRPMIDSTPKLFEEIGLTYSDRLIIPAIQESVKAVTANYTAEQLISQRPQVKQDIKDILTERLLERDLLVDDISITNFKFSDQFDAAIEAKVTAEQQALEADDREDRAANGGKRAAHGSEEAEGMAGETSQEKDREDVERSPQVVARPVGSGARLVVLTRWNLAHGEPGALGQDGQVAVKVSVE